MANTKNQTKIPRNTISLYDVASNLSPLTIFLFCYAHTNENSHFNKYNILLLFTFYHSHPMKKKNKQKHFAIFYSMYGMPNFAHAHTPTHKHT